MSHPLPTHEDFTGAVTSLVTQLRLLKFSIPPEVSHDVRTRIETELAGAAELLQSASVAVSFFRR
jgi:hypothetical protein